MNSIIYKYVFEDTSLYIRMGGNDYPLHVGLDPVTQKAAVWVNHWLDEEPDIQECTFQIIMTGQMFDETNKVYVGTVQQGRLMLHVYWEARV